MIVRAPPRHDPLYPPKTRAWCPRAGRTPQAGTRRDSTAGAGWAAAPLSPRRLQAGAEPAPVDDQVVDGPQSEDDVDRDQPAVDASGIRLDLAVGEVVDGAALVIGRRVRHARSPRAAPGAWRPRRRSGRRSARPTRTRTAPPAPSRSRRPARPA